MSEAVWWAIWMQVDARGGTQEAAVLRLAEQNVERFAVPGTPVRAFPSRKEGLPAVKVELCTSVERFAHLAMMLWAAASAEEPDRERAAWYQGPEVNALLNRMAAFPLWRCADDEETKDENENEEDDTQTGEVDRSKGFGPRPLL